MYAVTSMPLERRTRATLRRAEFGFLGVVVYTRVHTPRRWGEPLSAGVLALLALSWRPLRTSWLMVGNLVTPLRCCGRPSGGRLLDCSAPRPPRSGVSPSVSKPVLPPALPDPGDRRRRSKEWVARREVRSGPQ